MIYGPFEVLSIPIILSKKTKAMFKKMLEQTGLEHEAELASYSLTLAREMLDRRDKGIKLAFVHEDKSLEIINFPGDSEWELKQ